MKFIIFKESDGWRNYPKPCEEAVFYKHTPETKEDFARDFWTIEFDSIADLVKWAGKLNKPIEMWETANVPTAAAYYDGLPCIEIMDVDPTEEYREEIERLKDSIW